jgi:hypothetical protein
MNTLAQEVSKQTAFLSKNNQQEVLYFSGYYLLGYNYLGSYEKN